MPLLTWLCPMAGLLDLTFGSGRTVLRDFGTSGHGLTDVVALPGGKHLLTAGVKSDPSTRRAAWVPWLAFVALVGLPSLTGSVCRAGTLHAFASLIMTEFEPDLPNSAYPDFVPRIDRSGETFATVSYADPLVHGFATAQADPRKLVDAGVMAVAYIARDNLYTGTVEAAARWEDTITIRGIDLPPVLTLRLNFHDSGLLPATIATDGHPDHVGEAEVLVGAEGPDLDVSMGAEYLGGLLFSRTVTPGIDSLRLSPGSFDVRYHLDVQLGTNVSGTSATGFFKDFLAEYYAPPIDTEGEGRGVDPLTFDSVFQSATFLDGSTPESRGDTLTFDSGMPSPNVVAAAVPAPPGLVLFAIGAAPLLGLHWLRRKAAGDGDATRT